MGGRTTPVVVRAVLVADMVGSTEIRSRLGDDLTDRLMKAYAELVETAFRPHDGVVRRWLGDGTTAVFESASAAIGAAIALQRSVVAYRHRADAITPFRIRIGISVGELVYDADDEEEHGIAMAEAARLEALAGPGEIVASDLVRVLGERRSSARFEALGTVSLRGLADPVSVVRVVDPEPAHLRRPLPTSLVVDRRFPLVGRNDALDEALGRWTEAAAGSTQTMFFSGQPGIGKSRFVAHLATRVHELGALVISGGCDADLSVPYQPFATALAATEDRAAELNSAITRGEGVLSALFSNRRDHRDAGTNDRLELFDAVARVLEELAHDQPVLLVLEDLHWAAAPTVELLRALHQRLDRARVFMVGTCRPPDRATPSPFHEFLEQLPPRGGVTQVELTPLALPDVIELMGAKLLTAPPERLESFGRRLLDDSAGNPFFVCELLHHLSTTGELNVLLGSGTSEKLPIPETVRGVVRQRLARLPDGVAALLPTAAVVGQTFDLDLLAALANEPLERVVDLVEQAERGSLLHERSAGVFAFAHAIVRTTVLEDMSATRRQLAHRRVAEALEQLRPGDHDQLTHHWQLAGDRERSAAHLALAARRDLEALAFESAADHYQQLVDHHGTQPTPDAARAWLGLGLSQRALGDPWYLVAVLEAGRRARRLRDADLLADAALASRWLGTYFVAAKVSEGMPELAEDALAAISTDDPRRPRILTTLATQRPFDERIALVEEARAIAIRLGDPVTVGHVLISEYFCLWTPATAARRDEIAVELARVGRAAGDTELAFFAGFFGALRAAERADLVDARQRITALEPILRSTHHAYFEFLVERLRLSIDLYLGASDAQHRIDELAQRFSATYADTGNTWAAQTADLARQQGRLGPLVPAIRAVLEGSDLAPKWIGGLGLALLADGQRAEAFELLESFVEPEFDQFWLAAMQAMAEVAVQLGHRDRARAFEQRLAPYVEQLAFAGPGSGCFGLVSTTLAQLIMVDERWEEAEALLGVGLDIARKLGAPYEMARIQRLLATVLIRLGRDADRVTTLVENAHEVATRHGFADELRILEQLAFAPPVQR